MKFMNRSLLDSIMRVYDDAFQNGRRQAVNRIKEYVKSVSDISVDEAEEFAYDFIDNAVLSGSHSFKCLLDKDRRFVNGVARILCENNMVVDLNTGGFTSNLFKEWHNLDVVLTKVIQSDLDLNSALGRRQVVKGIERNYLLTLDDLISLSRENNDAKHSLIRGHSYQVYPVRTFNEASQYRKYADFCTFLYDFEFEDYQRYGKMFIALRDDIDSLPKRTSGMTRDGYDDYGFSMITVFINDKGDYFTTCRWNPTKNNMRFLSKEELKTLLGVEFNKIKY